MSKEQQQPEAEPTDLVSAKLTKPPEAVFWLWNPMPFSEAGPRASNK